MAGRVRGPVLKRDPEKDPQQDRLYEWGSQFLHLNMGSAMTLRRVHGLVNKIARMYRVKKPRVTLRSIKGNWWAYAADGDEVVFNSRSASHTPFVVAHEMAHIVLQNYGLYPRYTSHGALFAGVLAYILDKAQIMPATATIPSMRAGKVRYRRPHMVRPAALWALAKKNKGRDRAVKRV